VLFRIAGPHNPALDAPGRTIRAMLGASMRTLSSAPQPEMPKIAPGHPLSAATTTVTPGAIPYLRQCELGEQG
jgi:hypothetical protein